MTALPAGLALLYAAWKREGSIGGTLRRTLGWGAIVSLSTLLVAGWWFARNLILHNDLTGWAFILETNALREGPLTLDVIWWLARGLFTSFWLGLDRHRPAPGALSGAARHVPHSGGRPGAPVPRRRDSLSRDAWVGMGLLALQIALVLASLLQWTATVLGTDQARLVYPALPALLAFLALGLAQWTPPHRDRWLAGGLGGLFLLLAVAAPWVYIAPVHAGPTPISAGGARRDSRADSDRFGETIQLAGYRRDPTARAGDWFYLDLYWKALRPIDEDLWLTISLAGDDPAQPLVVKDGSPTAGRDTTDRWETGQILPSRHRLLAPAHAEAGQYGVLDRHSPLRAMDLATESTGQ